MKCRVRGRKVHEEEAHASVDERRLADPGRVTLLGRANIHVRPLALGPEAGVDGYELVSRVLQERDRVRHHLRVRGLDRLVVEDEVRGGVRLCKVGVHRLGLRGRGAVRVLGILGPEEELYAWSQCEIGPDHDREHALL